MKAVYNLLFIALFGMTVSVNAEPTSNSQVNKAAALDPFLGIDKDLLAEEEALLAKVKVVPAKEKSITNPSSNSVKAATTKAITTKAVKTSVAKTPIVKKIESQKIITKVESVKAKPLPATQTVSQPVVASTTNVVDTTRINQLENDKSNLQTELRSATVRLREVSAELARTKDKLMISETEVERLSKILNNRREEKLASISGRPIPIETKMAQSDRLAAQPRMAVGPSGALVANNRNYLETSNTAVSSGVSDMPVATVISDKAYLRTGPGRDNSPIMSVKNGTKLAVEVREGEWYRVTSPTGDRAWIAADVVAFNGGGNTGAVKSTVRVLGYDRSLDQAVINEEDKAFQLIKER